MPSCSLRRNSSTSWFRFCRSRKPAATTSSGDVNLPVATDWLTKAESSGGSEKAMIILADVLDQIVRAGGAAGSGAVGADAGDDQAVAGHAELMFTADGVANL